MFLVLGLCGSLIVSGKKWLFRPKVATFNDCLGRNLGVTYRQVFFWGVEEKTWYVIFKM